MQGSARFLTPFEHYPVRTRFSILSARLLEHSPLLLFHQSRFHCRHVIACSCLRPHCSYFCANSMRAPSLFGSTWFDVLAFRKNFGAWPNSSTAHVLLL